MLVVHSSRGVRRSLQRGLERIGAAAFRVDSAAVALERLSREIFDVVVIGRFLDDGDGLLLAAKIRTLPLARRSLLILVNSKPSFWDVVRCARGAVDGYWALPMRAAELRYALRRHLKRRGQVGMRRIGTGSP